MSATVLAVVKESQNKIFYITICGVPDLFMCRMYVDE